MYRSERIRTAICMLKGGNICVSLLYLVEHGFLVAIEQHDEVKVLAILVQHRSHAPHVVTAAPLFCVQLHGLV